MLKQSQIASLKPLITKIDSEISQIKYRSINNLHNKITHNLIDPALLIHFPQFPGKLMNWINDQCQLPENQITVSTMEYLLKVLTILATYVQYEEGMFLLKKYECLQFCEGFRRYFNESWAYRGTKILVNDILGKLNEIIKKMAILGRSQPQKAEQKTQISQQSQNSQPQASHSNPIPQKPQKKPQQQFIQLKFKTLMLKIPEPIEKKIFDIIVQIKYNKKLYKHAFLQQLLHLLKYYQKYYLRNKPEIFQLMNELLLEQKYYHTEKKFDEKIVALSIEVVCEIIVVLLQGLWWNHVQCVEYEMEATHYNSVYVNEGKSGDVGQWKRVAQSEQQIQITKYIQNTVEGYIVIQKLLQIKKQNKHKHNIQVIGSQTLLNLRYTYSPKYFLELIKLYSIQQNLPQNIALQIQQSIKFYCEKFPQFSTHFLSIVPHKICSKIQLLQEFQQQTTQETAYEYFRSYFYPHFHLPQHFHQIPQIIEHLQAGIDGIIIDPQAMIPIYIDVWLTLAISVAREDPLMAYYPSIKQIIIRIAAHQYQQVTTELYKAILKILQDESTTLEYLNNQQRKCKILEIVFCQEALTSNLLRCSLDSEHTLFTMLEIVKYFLLINRQNLFIKYIPIFSSCCFHPTSQHIRELSLAILKAIPKKYKIITVILKLFSSDQETRCNILEQLTYPDQVQKNKEKYVCDLVMKISEGCFKNNKKELKVSKQSICNYINIILNNDLQLDIRKSAATQLGDYLQRMNPSSAPKQQLQQFSDILHHNLYNSVKNKEDPELIQRYVQLYAVLCLKIEIFQKQLDLEFLASLLGLVRTDRIKVSVLMLIYQKCFESPFGSDQQMKNWVMKYYPHVEILQMSIETPTRIYRTYESAHNKIKSKNLVNPLSPETFQQFYLATITNCLHSSKPTINLKLLEKYLISSLSHHNFYEVTKFSFLLSRASSELPQNNISAFVINYLINMKANPNFPAIEMDLVHLISLLGFKKTKNLENYLMEMGDVQSLHKLLMWEKNANYDDAVVEKLMKMCDSNIDNDGLLIIYKLLSKKKQVQWQKYGEYPNLRLLQSLIKAIKTQNQLNLKLLSLLLLKKYLHENSKGVLEHKASIIGLFTVMLFEKRQIFTGQLVLVLDCVGVVVKYFENGDLPFYRKVIKKCVGMLKQVLVTSSNKSNQLNNSIVIGSIFRLYNQGLKLYLKPHTQSFGTEILQQIFQQNSCVDTGVLFLNPKILGSLFDGCSSRQKMLYLISNIIEYLYLECVRVFENIEYLLKSTNLLSDVVEIIVGLEQTNRNQGCSKIEQQAFHTIGQLLQILAMQPDDFLNKLIRIITPQSFQPQHKNTLTTISDLLSTLSKPIFKLSSISYSSTSRPINSYLTMFNWLLTIWINSQELSTKYPINIEACSLIDCYIKMKNIRLAHALTIQNISAQKWILNKEELNTLLKDEIKFVSNIEGDSEVRKSKRKNVKSRVISEQDFVTDITQKIGRIKQFCLFLSSIYTPRPISPNQQQQQQEDQGYQPTYFQRQNITLTIKYIEKIYKTLNNFKNSDTLNIEQQKTAAEKLLHKLLVNYFNSPLTPQILGNYIAEGNSHFVDELIGRVLKLGQSEGQVYEKENFRILGDICCCESVRSLMFKHRVIEELNMKIIRMEQNKVAKYNYSALFHILTLYGYLSIYKDANIKILNDKRILDFLCRILTTYKSQLLEQKIFEVLINLSSYKHHKPIFMANKEIHKVCLGFLGDTKLSYRFKVLSVVYNILYKNAAGVKMYRKKEVIELLREIKQGVDDEYEKEGDKLLKLTNIVIQILEKQAD